MSSAWKRVFLLATGASGAGAILAKDEWKNSSWLDAKRAGNAALAFTKLSAAYKVLKWKCRGLDERECRVLREETHNAGAEIVLELCRNNGGIFIKFGQHAASLKGAIPKEYITKLAVLQDRAPRRSKEEVLAVLQEELGKEAVQEMIESVEEDPIGCASLAQVHRATLQGGKLVALKVQHHDLENIVQSDIKLVKTLDRLASKLFSEDSFSLAWAVNEFESNLRQELDFLQEARNCQRCKENFAKEDYLGKKVRVPQVFWNLTTRKLICMEFIDGIPIHRVDKIRESGVDPKEVSKVTLAAFATMIFRHGFVHADPHPGNLSVIVCPGEEKTTFAKLLNSFNPWNWWNSPKEVEFQLALLDHGLYRELNESFRESNCKLWQGMILQDEKVVKNACKAMGIGQLWELVPFMLVNRTTDSESRLGIKTTMGHGQITLLKQRLGLKSVTFRDLGTLADKLPGDMVFVMKVWHLIKDLNDALGGTNRERFLVYARYAVAGEQLGKHGWQSETTLTEAWDEIWWNIFLARFYSHEFSRKPTAEKISDILNTLSLGIIASSNNDAQGSTLSMSSFIGETYNRETSSAG